MRITDLSQSYIIETCAKKTTQEPCDTSEDALRNQSLVALAKRDYESAVTLLRKTLVAQRKGSSRLARSEAFSCERSFECRPESIAEDEEALPDDWQSRPMICRGAHNILEFLKPQLPRFMNSTQLTGITRASAANSLLPEFSKTMGNVTGNIAAVGSVAGAIVNTLRLVEGVCVDGWSFLAACRGKKAMLSVVLAIVGMSLAFTGVGVPFTALLLGSSSFVVRRLGTMICEKGLMESLKSMGSAAYQMIEEAFKKGEEWATALGEGNLYAKAKEIAINFFRMFWAMLKSMPQAVSDMIKKVTDPTPSANIEAVAKEKRRVSMCCAAQAAKESFNPEEMQDANREFGEEVTAIDCEEAQAAREADHRAG
jgi:hypothetical protein